jgi:hypothetical protein
VPHGIILLTRWIGVGCTLWNNFTYALDRGGVNLMEQFHLNTEHGLGGLQHMSRNSAWDKTTITQQAAKDYTD